MERKHIHSNTIVTDAKTLKAGDTVLFSGTVYTARDAAHKKLVAMIDNGDPLPFDLQNATVYYAGPTPAPEGMVIGSCGPTTSGRMDPYSPKLLDLGLKCMIGKGERNPEVIDAIVRNGAVYLCAIGGAGALAAQCVKSLEVIAFPELGCESIKHLEVENFPLIVAIDSEGNNLFERTSL